LAAAVVANLVLAAFVVMALNEEPTYPPLPPVALNDDALVEPEKPEKPERTQLKKKQ